MGIFPPHILKLKKRERKRKVTYLLFTIHLKKTGGGLLVFFAHELAIFRIKNYKETELLPQFLSPIPLEPMISQTFDISNLDLFAKENS